MTEFVISIAFKNLIQILSLYIIFIVGAIINNKVRKLFAVLNVIAVVMAVYVLISKINFNNSNLYHIVKYVIASALIIFDSFIYRLSFNFVYVSRLFVLLQCQPIDFYLNLLGVVSNNILYGSFFALIKSILYSDESFYIDLSLEEDYLISDDSYDVNINNLYCVYRL